MKKYLLIILPFLFISCGSDSSKNDDKTNIKTNSENISYEKIFSNNNIEKKSIFGSISKDDIVNGYLEFPKEKYLNNINEMKEYLESRYSLKLNNTPLVKKVINYTSYKFVQDNIKASECGSSINITMDKDNKVFKTYIYKIKDFSICKRAEGYIPKKRSLNLEEPPSLNKGSLVKVPVKIFLIDPLTDSEGDLEITVSIDEIKVPDSTYIIKDVDALKVGNKIYLANERVRAVDFISTQEVLDGPFIQQQNQQGVFFTENAFTKVFFEKQFLDQMAFYHLDSSIKYLEELGYTNENAIFKEALKFDSQVYAGNKSMYKTDLKLLTYGIGGAPDASDADVIRHELAHAINFEISSDFNAGDTGAMGEGFADYWAGYYSLFEQKDKLEVFQKDIVFNFDGLYGLNKSRRSLNNKDAKYSPFAVYSAHVKVNGQSADELWSTPLFSTLKDSIDLYKEDAFDEVNTILLESFSGIGYGIKMLQMAENIVKTAKDLYPNKKYSEIFLNNFKQHNIIQDKLTYVFNNDYISKDTKLNFTYTNKYFENLNNLNLSLSSNEINIKNNIYKNSILEINSTKKSELVFDLDENLECSSQIKINISNLLNLPNQRVENNLNTKTLTYGLPIFDSMPIIVNTNIPNATKTSNLFNPLSVVPMLFTQRFTSDELISEDFAYILELSSENLSQIKVELISPNKEKINLLSKEDYINSNIKKVFSFKNNKLLKNLINTNAKGGWYLNIENSGLDNKTVLYRYGLVKVLKYTCK